jgi:hypothetical protein
MAPNSTSLTVAAAASILASGWAAGNECIFLANINSSLPFLCHLRSFKNKIQTLDTIQRADKVQHYTDRRWGEFFRHLDPRDRQRGRVERGDGPAVAGHVLPRPRDHPDAGRAQRRQLRDRRVPLLGRGARVARVRGRSLLDLLHRPLHRHLHHRRQQEAPSRFVHPGEQQRQRRRQGEDAEHRGGPVAHHAVGEPECPQSRRPDYWNGLGIVELQPIREEEENINKN